MELSFEALREKVEHGLERIEQGARGYDDFLPDRLLRALERAPLVDEPALLYLSTHELSPRETQIVQACSYGMTNAMIASTYGLKEETVKTHMKHVRHKLRAKDRAHVVATALRRGLIQ